MKNGEFLQLSNGWDITVIWDFRYLWQYIGLPYGGGSSKLVGKIHCFTKWGLLNNTRKVFL
jgi:hypothetical protein